MQVCYEPSAQARQLQRQVDTAIAVSSPRVSVAAGDYYFGAASLLLHQAHGLSLQAESGSGTVHLWFCIGAGVLVNRSSDLVLDGLSIDYDPPAHYQGTITRVDDGGATIRAVVATDTGFLEPAAFDAAYREGTPGVQSGPSALVWNASDPGFGAYAPASWPPMPAGGGQHAFTLKRESLCTDINAVTTDGSSCLGGHARASQVHGHHARRENRQRPDETHPRRRERPLRPGGERRSDGCGPASTHASNVTLTPAM